VRSRGSGKTRAGGESGPRNHNGGHDAHRLPGSRVAHVIAPLRATHPLEANCATARTPSKKVVSRLRPIARKRTNGFQPARLNCVLFLELLDQRIPHRVGIVSGFAHAVGPFLLDGYDGGTYVAHELIRWLVDHMAGLCRELAASLRLHV